MARTLADRVQETTITAGLGTLDLAGASVGFQGFVAGAGDAAEVDYTIVGRVGGAAEGEWEVGIGTVTDAAPDTLSRDTVLSSSTGAKVNFSAGTKDVFLTIPATAPVTLVEFLEPAAAANIDIDISGCESVKVVGWLAPANDNVDCWLRFSNDGGATFEEGAAYYAWCYYAVSTGTSQVVDDDADSEIALGNGIGSAGSEAIAVNFTIMGANAAAIATMITNTSYTHTFADTYAGILGGGIVHAAEVNNAIRLLFSAGNIASGRLAIYRYPAP